MVDVLGPLSARPPTPPRTASRMLSEKDRTEDSPVTVQTPIESHFLQNDSTGAPSSRQSKRVNFSPWPNFIKAPSFTDAKPSEIKALLPSNDRKPTRSILKATNSPGPVSPAGLIPNTPESFAMLLESITQQLAGESTSSRIDAYMQFFGALRAYEKVPTEDEIMRKLGLITQFIQRDISRDLKKGGTLDTNVVIYALKLSVVLVWHPQISPQLPEDFKLFLLEHSVNCLEDGKLPKSVATHYLTLLSTQKFSTRIITTARATRILEMLHGLTDRVKGNSVVSQRLTIYERLFELSKSTFISHSTLWMDHLVSGLLHQIKNVRLNALELGFNAYMASGANSTLSKTLRDIFDRPLANNRKLVSEISERMSRMMASPETGEHVPQIWGVITLLLRNKRFNIDQWQHFKEWVLVLQKCFNCSDPEIKSKAIGNWNRFVLVVNISESTTPSLLRMLSKPILSQFERKKHDKQNPQPSQLVVASYYNLLYYAFRPDASHQQLDIVWGEYIASPSSNIFASVPSLSDRLAHALSRMLWSSHPIQAWSDNRVNEPKRIVAEELPPLDCKWVRSRVPSVLKVFEDILKSSVWDPELEKSNIATAWVSLSYALAFAASKEITPSQESMQTVAHVLGLLERLWHAGPSSLNAAGENTMDTFFERFRFLSTTMISALGSIPFTEKLLLKTADSTYQASNTPTHRNSKASNQPDSPILHLLRLISDVSQILAPTPAYSRLIKDTVEASCHGKASRGSRLDILKQCANVYPDGSDDSEFLFGSGGFAQISWTSAAQLSADCLCSFPIESARERDGSITRDYTTVFMILCQGLRFADKSLAWDRLLDALIRVMRTERGDLSIATMVLEPLAGQMMGLDVRSAFSPASSMINHSLSINFDYDSGVKSGSSNTNSPPHPHALIGLAHRVLSESYEFSDPQNLDAVAIFIESIVSFLGSGTFTFRSVLLDNLQSPLGLYLKDAMRKYTVENGVESKILTACRAISTAILDILQILPHDAWNLQKYEHIICSGLMSSHISTAKRFADFWKSSFGIQQFLPCPPLVSQALGDLEARFDSQLAGVLHGPTLASQTSHLGLGLRQHTNTPVAQNSNVTSEDAPAKSKIDFILDAPTVSAYSAHMESSSIIEGSQSAASTLQKTESSIHQVAPEGTADNATTIEGPHPPSAKEDTTRHREVFSMIDSLRSSSPPTTTPGGLGFMTPPHLRSLRNEESGTETPKTPTIAAVAAENEDGFLGSSPTPAIRGRTSSVAPAIPPPFAEPGASMDIDPPSSPPEPERQSTDSGHDTPQPSTKGKNGKNNKRRSRSRRSKTPSKGKSPKKEMPDNAPTHNEQAGQNMDGLSQKSLRSRLRSAVETSPAKNESTEPQRVDQTEKAQQAPKEPKTLCNEPGHNSVAVREPIPELTPVLHNENPDVAVESASEDTDTQAMSQLEHDLVFAVDLGSDAADKEAAEHMQTAAATRKRKREGENWTIMAKEERERRRSSRISSTSTPTAEVEDSQTMRSKKPKLSTVSRETPPSPANSAAKKRKHDAVDSASVTPKRDRSKKNKDTAQEKDMQESQKRRSGRISGVPGPDLPPAEEDPGPKKSPRPSSSRKPNKKQKNRRSERRQSQPAEEASNQEATAAGESAHEKADESQQPQPQPTDNRSEQPLESRSSPQVNEPEPHPSQEEPPKQSDDVEMAEVLESVQPEAQVEAQEKATTDEPQLETEMEHHAPSEPIQALQSPPLPEQEPQPEPEQEQTTELEPAPQPNQDTQISTSLRCLIDQVKLASLDRNAVKEMDDLLFDLRVEMHEALRRHRQTTAATSIQ